MKIKKHSFLIEANTLRKAFCAKISVWNKRRKNKYHKAVIFISTPMHGNLGDHAIVEAQYALFDSMGMKDSIYEFSKEEYYRFKKYMHLILKPSDIIVIDGGGSIGTLWIQEEEKIRDIVRRFNKNPILIFPQTAFYEDSDYGVSELNKTISLFKSHSNLTVFCRDIPTFELFKKCFNGVESYYTPDTVLFLDIDDIINRQDRKYVSVCFRNDLEGVVSKELSAKISDILSSCNISMRKIDTVENKKIDKFTRENELRKKWEEFAGSRFVITDRLHGMIFCAITGTPCIAMDNISHKVKNGYTWISYLPYIHFAETEDELLTLVHKLSKSEDRYKYDRLPLIQYYSPILNVINRYVNNSGE